MDIYEKGADFVDLIGFPDGKQDTIQLVVREGYLRQENNEGITKEKLNDLLDG